MNKGKGEKRTAETRRGSRFVNVKIWHLIFKILLLLCSKLLFILAIIILNNSNQNEKQFLNGDFYCNAIKDPFQFPKKHS